MPSMKTLYNSPFQYIAFSNHLQGGDIGITGWRLFYINKTTTSMVVLMIISYSLILLKFGSNDPANPLACEYVSLNSTMLI